jgi:hypothetical protein
VNNIAIFAITRGDRPAGCESFEHDLLLETAAVLSETLGTGSAAAFAKEPFMKFFGSLWRRRDRRETETILLNGALDLALDFDNWLSPIQRRLEARYPSLDGQQLDQLNQVCMEATRFGQETALHLCATMDLPLVQGRFEKLFIDRYPWVSHENLERAYRHCIYLATKTARAG